MSDDFADIFGEAEIPSDDSSALKKPMKIDDFDDIFGETTVSVDCKNDFNGYKDKESSDFTIASARMDEEEFMTWLDGSGTLEASQSNLEKAEFNGNIDETLKENKTVSESTITKKLSTTPEKKMVRSYNSSYKVPQDDLKRIAAGDIKAENVEYVRSLCLKLGTTLPSNLRASLWAILLGCDIHARDADFDQWNSFEDSEDASAEGLDLDNQRLSNRDRQADTISSTSINKIVTFFCKRHKVKYEPILSTIAGTLFKLKIGPSFTSALLYPFISNFTLFIGRGLSEGAKLLAENYSHSQFHFLCAYHAPFLTQHLDRCFPGWEMPLRDFATSTLSSSVERRVSNPEDGVDSGSSSAIENKGHAFSNKKNHGFIEPSLLSGAWACIANKEGLDHMMVLFSLWDHFIIRHDKHFGYFLLLALLLREKSILMGMQGPNLREHLSNILSGKNLLFVDDIFTDENENMDVKNALMDSSINEWCLEAETLDFATPQSFRQQVSLVGERAQYEHSKLIHSMIAEKNAGGEPIEISNAIDSSKNLEKSKEEGLQTFGIATAKFSKMREMIFDASTKMGEHMENRSKFQGNNQLKSSKDIEDYTVIEDQTLPQLCLEITAQEALNCLLIEGNKSMLLFSNEDSARSRKSLPYYAVDCRPIELVSKGRFPSVFHLDPAAMNDPEQGEIILETFQPLLGKVHICLFGIGINSNPSVEAANVVSSSCFKAAMDDYARINTVALFFMKKGYPYVSVLRGGFSSIHELLSDPFYKDNLACLVDHNPLDCMYCGSTCQHIGELKPPQEKKKIDFSIKKVFMKSEKDKTSAASEKNGNEKGLSDILQSSFKDSISLPKAFSSRHPTLNSSSTIKSSQIDSSKLNQNTGSDYLSDSKRMLNLFPKTNQKSGNSQFFSDENLRNQTASLQKKLSFILPRTSSKGVFIIGDAENDSEYDSEHNFSEKQTSDTKKTGKSVIEDIPLLEHQLAGATKGSSISIEAYSSVPGAIKFDVMKRKRVAMYNEKSGSEITRQVSEPENVSENPDLDSNTASPNLHGVEKKEKFEFYPRVLFFTRERILILVASDMSSNEYMVKSNRHLTELSKVTFFKRDPSLITLHYNSGLDGSTAKRNIYKLKSIQHKDELVQCLHSHFKRFSS